MTTQTKAPQNAVQRDGDASTESAPPAGRAVTVIEAPAAEIIARPPSDPLLSAVAVLKELRGMAEMLVASGFMPKSVNTPEKAMAIMLTGREMSIGPMLAIRSVHIIDAKPVVSADLQLSLFKAAGGRTTFVQLDEKGAILALRHPNGDEHVETFTHAMARDAGLLGKDNWKKHLVAMFRSRVITAGLKSIGFEATAGVYDPDEADHWSPGASAAIEAGDDPNAPAPRSISSSRGVSDRKAIASSTPATTTGAMPSQSSTSEPTGTSRYASVWPTGPHLGKSLDSIEAAGGTYTFSTLDLEALGEHVAKKLKAGGAKDPVALKQLGLDLVAEFERRVAETDARARD